MEAVSLTSLNVAAHRAIETERSDALFCDPFARRLAGDEGFRFAREIAETSSLPTAPNLPSMFAVRTRFYDDALAESTSTQDVRQVVVVGAGMDTRAYRMQWPAGTQVFEVDRATRFAYKEPVLQEAGAVPLCTRRVVAADLREQWHESLIAAGFRPEHPTAWAAEGVLYYLSESQAHRLVQEVTHLSAPRSVLVADVAPTLMRDLDQLQRWRDLLGARGEPFRFFTDDGPALLSEHGWDVTTATSIAEVAARHGITYPGAGNLGARRLLTARRQVPNER